MMSDGVVRSERGPAPDPRRGEGSPPAHMPAGRLAALLAHELNTPLQAICNLLFLAERELGPQPQGGYIQQVRAEVDRLSLVLGQLLSLAQPDAPRGALAAAELVERPLALLAPLLARRRLTVVRELAPGLPPILGEPGPLAQVIFELLLALADAATGERLWVHGALQREPGGPAVRLLLSLAPPGPAGAPPARPAPAAAPRPELALSRAVVERHGGTLAALADGDGALSFALLLPAQGAPACPAGTDLAAISYSSQSNDHC